MSDVAGPTLSPDLIASRTYIVMEGPTKTLNLILLDLAMPITPEHYCPAVAAHKPHPRILT